MVPLRFFCLIMARNFSNDTLTYVCEEFCIEQHFTSPYTPRSNGKTENFNKFLKASIRKLTSEVRATWDQVLDQILFAYRCCPHTSTGEAPYTLVYARDPYLPIQNLIKIVVPYKGNNELGKRIEQSRVSLSIAAKWLSKMKDRQKKYYLNRRSTHPFKGDLVLLKKHHGDKMDLKWVPNYRVIKLTSAWSAIVENQTNGKTKGAMWVTSNLNIHLRIGNSSPVLWEELLSLLITWITSQTLTPYLTMTNYLTSLMLTLSTILEETSRVPQS